MQMVGESQQITEQEVSAKFAAVQELAEQVRPSRIVSTAGRINPQLSCTISPEDMEILNDLVVYAVNKERKPINLSRVIRALIRHGDKNKEDLIF